MFLTYSVFCHATFTMCLACNFLYFCSVFFIISTFSSPLLSSPLLSSPLLPCPHLRVESLATIDWEAIPCWIAWFPAVWRELRVPSTCLGDRVKATSLADLSGGGLSRWKKLPNTPRRVMSGWSCMIAGAAQPYQEKANAAVTFW